MASWGRNSSKTCASRRKKFGAEFQGGAVTKLTSASARLRSSLEKDMYETKALIVAAGASARLWG